MLATKESGCLVTMTTRTIMMMRLCKVSLGCQRISNKKGRNHKADSSSRVSEFKHKFVLHGETGGGGHHMKVTRNRMPRRLGSAEGTERWYRVELSMDLPSKHLDRRADDILDSIHSLYRVFQDDLPDYCRNKRRRVSSSLAAGNIRATKNHQKAQDLQQVAH